MTGRMRDVEAEHGWNHEWTRSHTNEPPPNAPDFADVFTTDDTDDTDGKKTRVLHSYPCHPCHPWFSLRIRR